MNGTREMPKRYPHPPVAFTALLLLAALFALNGCATPSLASKQTETLSKLGFEQVSDGWQLTLPDRILFEFDKANLAPAAHDSIADAARQLLAVNIHQLHVAGHTDNIGAREYNEDLSLRRANSVTAVLLAEGFAKADVESRGYGASQPAADNATEEGRAQNRRVEIIVTSNVLAAP